MRAFFIAMALLVMLADNAWAVAISNDAAAQAITTSMPIRAAELIPGEDGPQLYKFVRHRNVPGDAQDPVPYLDDLSKFEELTSKSYQFRSNGDRILFIFSVRNRGKEKGNWILSTMGGLVKNFTLSDVTGGKNKLLFDTNDKEQARRVLRTYNIYAHELELQPGEEKKFAVLIDDERIPKILFEVQSRRSFADFTFITFLLVVGSSTSIFAIILVSVCIYTVSGRSAFLWMGLAELFSIFQIFHTGGLASIYTPYDDVETVIAIGFLFYLLFNLAMAQFARSFVMTRENSPMLDRILLSLLFAGLVTAAGLMGSFVTTGSAFLNGTAAIISLCITLILPYIAFVATRRLGSYHWPLIVAWTGMAIFTIYSAIVSFRIAPELPFSWFSHGPIGLFHTLFCFLALLFYLKNLNRERLDNALQLNKSLVAQQKIAVEANKLTLEKEDAMSTIRDQENLIHASGHDSQHVLMALKTIIKFADELDSDKLRSSLPEMLRSSAGHLENIIGTTLANPVAGFQSANFVALSTFNAAELSHSLETIYAPMMRKEQMNLRLQTEDDLMLVSDRALLARILSNLLSNSMKFAKGSEVTVSTRSVDSIVHITVTDEGEGIPKHLADKICDASAMRIMSSDPETGTGFGLLSSKRIATTLGGDLQIEQSAQGGACVSITLPHLVTKDGSTSLNASKILKQLPDYTLVDVDAFDERGTSIDTQMQEAGAGNRLILPISFDNSSQMAGKISKHATLMLLKPVTSSMINHPLLSEIARQYRENQQKEESAIMTQEEPS